ncbi:hypothetical protein YC2023_075106 [Brassica napus]
MRNLPPSGLSQPLYPWILWNLWLCRNQNLFEEKRFSEIETTTKAIKDCREWQLAQPLKPPTTSVNPPPPPPPPNGGWIIKDQTRLTLLQGSAHRRCIASALVAEALAIKDSIDCKSLIDLVTGNSSVTSIQVILHDIGVMSQFLDSISFSFIPRIRNEAADRLAKAALVVSVTAPLV